MEFKPGMSVYCIKNISVKRINQQEYEENKAMQLQREDYVQSGTLSAVHFNPQNILKRMNFKLVEAEEESPDANTPTESEAAS